MVKSDDGFEDFELGDDIEDVWDDPIDDIDDADANGDSDDSKKSGTFAADGESKKSKLIVPLVALTVLGSGAYLFLPLLMPSNTQDEIAIVKIEEPSDASSGDIENTELSDIVTALPTETETAGNAMVAPHANPLDSGYGEILTPMPEEFTSEIMPLMDMEQSSPLEILEVVDAIQSEVADDKALEEALIEDELFLKTEKSFEDFPQDDVMQDIVNFKENLDTPINDAMPVISAEEMPALDLIAPEEPLFTDTVITDTPDIIEAIEVEEDSIQLDASINGDAIDKAIIESEPEIEIVEKEVAIATPKPSPAIASPVITISPKHKKPAAVVKKKKPLQKKKPIWVIRAAQSGSAIIYDKISKEMQSIEINDVVNGIGRVKSIKIIDGIWVIVGSKGRIEQ